MENQVLVSRRPNIVNAVVGFKVTSVDDAGYLCNVTVEFNGKSVNKKGVHISGLLRHKLRTQPEDYKVGKLYTSVNNSSDWKENPFQLIRYRDRSGNDVLMLACVNERTHIVETVVDPLGDSYDKITYRFHSVKYYMRYRDLYTNAKK